MVQKERFTCTLSGPVVEDVRRVAEIKKALIGDVVQFAFVSWGKRNHDQAVKRLKMLKSGQITAPDEGMLQELETMFLSDIEAFKPFVGHHEKMFPSGLEPGDVEVVEVLPDEPKAKGRKGSSDAYASWQD